MSKGSKIPGGKHNNDFFFPPESTVQTSVSFLKANTVGRSSFLGKRFCNQLRIKKSEKKWQQSFLSDYNN